MDETEVVYGTIGMLPSEEYNPNKQYEILNLVSYDGSSYVVHTKPPIGTLPTNLDYWQVSALGTSKATANSVGTVKPDGTTTEVSTEGSLSVKTATQNTLGLVKGSNGIKVGTDGSIDVNTLFTQATELANIIAEEAISSVLGKISKTIAVTIGLNENALLKNMLTNMDANDQNKIPTSAFVHNLWARIGMDEDLDIGANLTAVVKALNSNLTELKNKSTSDLSYISSFIPRVNDFNGSGGSATLLADITYMINTKGILTGGFGYSNVAYTDKPAGASNWGYVEYFRHGDDNVTVKIYPGSSAQFFVGRFILGQSTWSVPWKTIQYTT